MVNFKNHCGSRVKFFSNYGYDTKILYRLINIKNAQNDNCFEHFFIS